MARGGRRVALIASGSDLPCELRLIATHHNPTPRVMKCCTRRDDTSQNSGGGGGGSNPRTLWLFCFCALCKQSGHHTLLCDTTPHARVER